MLLTASAISTIVSNLPDEERPGRLTKGSITPDHIRRGPNKVDPRMTNSDIADAIRQGRVK